MKKGTIFDLKEFAIFDGPDIRQTVFFKGCPLRCNWCHNPEGLEMRPQLMVSGNNCIGCGRCAAVCTHDPCNTCGDCVRVCPQGLRKICGTDLTSQQLVDLIRKDSGYYAKYGGGVTFSGGEPLMQPDFLLEVVTELPDVHKAVETSGYADAETFAAVADAMDYIMIDMKHMDSKIHKCHTGVDNTQILENVRWLCAGVKPFVVRIPVIPGVNDTEENYRQVAALLAGATALQRVELLPYHKTAGAKYAMVGKSYEPQFNINDKIKISQKIFTDCGIRSCVL